MGPASPFARRRTGAPRGRDGPTRGFPRGGTPWVGPSTCASVPTVSARAWNGLVTVVMAVLVALIAVTVLVVDPVQTVGGDLGALYRAMGPGGWVGIGVLLLVWAAVVAALTVGALLLGHLGWREWQARDRAVAWTARLAPALGVSGLVAAVSVVVPGFPVGLAFFSTAEELGTAPLSGSISPLLAGIGTAGLVLLGLALCATIAVPLLAGRHAGRRADDRPR